MRDSLISRPVDIELALRKLEGHFEDGKPRRYISGCALSSNAKNSHGDAYEARGVDVQLPLPILLQHDWQKPIGRVLAVEALENRLPFTAEIVNSDRLDWASKAWQKILAQDASRISVAGISLVDEAFAFDATTRCWTLTRWTLTEVSVVERGADAGAVIAKAWQGGPL